MGVCIIYKHSFKYKDKYIPNIPAPLPNHQLGYIKQTKRLGTNSSFSHWWGDNIFIICDRLPCPPDISSLSIDLTLFQGLHIAWDLKWPRVWSLHTAATATMLNMKTRMVAFCFKIVMLIQTSQVPQPSISNLRSWLIRTHLVPSQLFPYGHIMVVVQGQENFLLQSKRPNDDNYVLVTSKAYHYCWWWWQGDEDVERGEMT